MEAVRTVYLDGFIYRVSHWKHPYKLIKERTMPIVRYVISLLLKETVVTVSLVIIRLIN